MQAHERLTAAITAAVDAGRTALVPFITAGYPEPAEFVATLKSVAEVGDVVEIGIPFSDPMADGMTIQRSSFVALQKGVSLEWIFSQLESAGDIDAPLVMMSYLNPLLAFGYEALAERALAAGVCGFIVPDLPFEESGEIRQALEAKGLGLIQLVTPATPEDRLKTLCDASRGFGEGAKALFGGGPECDEQKRNQRHERQQKNGLFIAQNVLESLHKILLKVVILNI